jgi:hypothetical protein
MKMIDKGRGGIMAAALTQMEAQAFTDTRDDLWDALVNSIGAEQAAEVFSNIPGEAIDHIIHKVVRGYQRSMRLQSEQGGIPMPLNNGRTEDPDDELPLPPF